VKRDDVTDGLLTLSIVNDLAELTRVAESVDEFCEAQSVPQACAFKLNIALEELLTNTISYGFEDSGRHEIALTVACQGEEIVAEIKDDARQYDPLQEAPEPDLDSALEERRVGGLGVYLVKTLMDDVRYEYRDGQNRVTLRKNIASDPG
jgi:anti-sigma regulatory factor (Ser/Thr protein kinase)